MIDKKNWMIPAGAYPQKDKTVEPKASSLDKVYYKKVFHIIGESLADFLSSLFEEENEDDPAGIPILVDNPFTPKQLKWAVKKHLEFYASKNVIDKYYVPLVVSSPKKALVEVVIYVQGKRIEMKLHNSF